LTVTTLPPNEEQAVAIEAMIQHAKTTGDDPFLVLKAPAGAGKTFCVQKMREEFKGRTIFTAPTNKATRVLREVLNTGNIKEECRTTYSLLGLTMQPNGEVKELAKPEDPIDLAGIRLAVVDEAGMAGRGTEGRKGLMPFILEASKLFPQLRWLFVGDPYQLPPVGEPMGPVWELPKTIELTKIMRQDNQILNLSAHLRQMVQQPFGQLKIASDNDGEEGVWALGAMGLQQAILNQADEFLKGENKAIAWRNVEVDRLNRLIRQELFADSLAYPYQPGDRITLLGPVKDLAGEPVGTTDEEGTVELCEVASHPEHALKCYRIVMRSDLNTSMTLWALHPDDKGKFEYRKGRLSEAARANKREWGAFWSFVDAFAPVRHAYAITAHRAQGSTYKRAFVSWRDILINPTRGEAMRCLYVAATRPKKELYLG
jgi:exodeoxyribonuclease-5